MKEVLWRRSGRRGLNRESRMNSWKRRAVGLFAIGMISFFVLRGAGVLPDVAVATSGSELNSGVRITATAPAQEAPLPTNIPEPGWTPPAGFSDPNVVRWGGEVDRVVKELGMTSVETAGYDPRVITLAIIEAETHGVPQDGASGEKCIMQVSPAVFDDAGVPEGLRDDEYWCVRTGVDYLRKNVSRAVGLGYRGWDALRRGLLGYNRGPGNIGGDIESGFSARYVFVLERVCPGGSSSPACFSS